MKVSRFVASGGVTLTADVGGAPDRPAVILMHGGGQTRYSWGTAARHLVEVGYHVVSLDLRGHGDSDWAPDGDYRLDAFAADIRAIVATLDKPAALVGASIGGLTSLIAIGESSAPIATALVLVDIVPRIEATGRRRITQFMKANDSGFASIDEVADAVAAYLPHRTRPPAADGLRKNLRVRADGRLYWHWDPAFLSAHGEHAHEDEAERLRRAARNVTVPTLLVRGRLSEVVSPQGATELLELIPTAELVDVEKAGHMVAGDKNDIFDTAIEMFLGRIMDGERDRHR